MMLCVALVNMIISNTVIGASLSEPHTYRTTVQNPPDIYIYIIESVDSITRDERDAP